MLVGSPDPSVARYGPLMGLRKDDDSFSGFIETAGDSYRQMRGQQKSYFKNIQFLHNYAARHSHHGHHRARSLQKCVTDGKYF